MGDWGLPMGMLISEIGIREPEQPVHGRRFDGPFPADSPVTMADLEALYPAAAAACKADPARLEAARAATAALQAGRPGYWALWQHFFDVSVDGMRRDFASAWGSLFDLWKGEAIVHDLIAPMIDEPDDARAFAEVDDGATIVRVARDDDKSEHPAADPAEIGRRGHVRHDGHGHDRRPGPQPGPGLMLYVVDQRQHLHFEQVFRAARRPISTARRTGAYRLRHHERAGRQTVQDAGRRRDAAGRSDRHGHGRGDQPARRSGAGDRLSRREERAEIARRVGIAAVKFADLSNPRTSSYIFDLDRFTRF